MNTKNRIVKRDSQFYSKITVQYHESVNTQIELRLYNIPINT